jgi:hypothetical protein
VEKKWKDFKKKETAACARSPEKAKKVKKMKRWGKRECVGCVRAWARNVR